MQPDRSMVNNKAVLGIAAKELGQFFRAPIAWLFLAAFLLVTLFVFFWVEAFFSRNIADVRPLFEWMPLLLIFLSGALTMKMWSEERRSGTLEHVLTQPVPLWQFVIGKFLACWTLLAIALALTLPLPITVSLLGQLDWGPVFTGYLAALLLGGAYISIGLFVSARCDNQIVSLILSVALAAVFYIIGSSLLTGFLGNQTAEALRSVGTGSRFQSITRGVLDFRDLYYYVSLMVAFIVLNILALERGRWAKEGDRRHHSLWRWGTGLLIVNALLANFWLGQINALRWDTTRGSIYSISDATRNYLAQLQEPLLIRGYFSEKTHPLLSPLVPQMQDLLREYEIAGKGRVRVEIVDPTTDPKLEDEANNVYNIQSTPFRVSDRHQAALVNSYFNILVKYGDQHEVLGFNELIEVKAENDTSMDVLLRNPEYDITRAIKKTLYAYQSGGNLFDSVDSPLTLKAYISAESRLPPELVELRKAIEKEAAEMKAQSNGKFEVEFVDPDANGGAEGRRITEEYGFAPMAGLMNPEPFFFYLTLGGQNQLMQVPLGDYTAGAFKQSLNAGVKRFGKGFTRSIAVVKPKPEMDPMTPPQIHDASMERFGALRQILAEDANIIDEELADGRIDPAADVLVLVSPRLTTDKERFAVDQFLMRGGTVIAATSPYSASLERTSMMLKPHTSGMSDWLEQIGVSIDKQLVLDRRNSAFPVPVTRQVGGLNFQDMQLLDYPYFVDVRPDGLNQDVLVTAQLPQVTVPWASPIRIDEQKSQGLEVIPLLYSSEQSWLSDDLNITPSMDQVRSGFAVGENPQRHLLAVSIQGRFPSRFAGKDSPLLAQPDEAAGDTAHEENKEAEPAGADINMVLNHSAESARLILFASNDIFRDEIVSMLGAAQGGAYLNSLQLAVNSVDWSLEDQGLLSIRARGHFNRTLEPMEAGRQQFWEYLNYAIVLLALGILWFVYRSMTRARLTRYQRMLAA